MRCVYAGKYVEDLVLVAAVPPFLFGLSPGGGRFMSKGLGGLEQRKSLCVVVSAV
jgi:hypothetical protein